MTGINQGILASGTAKAQMTPINRRTNQIPSGESWPPTSNMIVWTKNGSQINTSHKYGIEWSLYINDSYGWGSWTTWKKYETISAVLNAYKDLQAKDRLRYRYRIVHIYHDPKTFKNESDRVAKILDSYPE